MAKTLERACFDFLMFEDALMVPDIYGGTTEHYLKNAILVPKNDPAPLAAVIGSHTSHIGIVATLSTLGYPPFLLARLCASIDHIAEGRFGWNIVTSGENLAAQNFGLDKITAHNKRYEMADEYVGLVTKLLESWDPDAIVLDRESRTYADFTKVRPVDHEGAFFKSRGPLNTAPLPHGRPLYVQAGGSPSGRDFAARHADVVISAIKGVEAMKAFRDDIRARATKHGRDPDAVKVLFLLAPVLGRTSKEAQAENKRGLESARFIDETLAYQSSYADIDLSQFDLDQPLPSLTTNGSIATLNEFAQFGSGKTLRQAIYEGGKPTSIDLVGTVDEVADAIAAAAEEIGGDGFLIRHPFGDFSRRYILEVAEGLVPVLQRRGLVRTAYSGSTLRDNLSQF